MHSKHLVKISFHTSGENIELWKYSGNIFATGGNIHAFIKENLKICVRLKNYSITLRD